MSTKRDPIIQQLKRLSSIEPDPVFTARLRSTIVDVPRLHVEKSRPFLRWRALALAGSGIFVALAVIITTQLSEPVTVRASSLDTTVLTKEFDELTLNIRLKEIGYQAEVNNIISEAVGEIVNTQTNHLNPSLIDAEQNILTLNEPTNSTIDKLLEELTK